jgi:hypothetical protein
MNRFIFNLFIRFCDIFVDLRWSSLIFVDLRWSSLIFVVNLSEFEVKSRWKPNARIFIERRKQSKYMLVIKFQFLVTASINPIESTKYKHRRLRTRTQSKNDICNSIGDARLGQCQLSSIQLDKSVHSFGSQCHVPLPWTVAIKARLLGVLPMDLSPWFAYDWIPWFPWEDNIRMGIQDLGSNLHDVIGREWIHWEAICAGLTAWAETGSRENIWEYGERSWRNDKFNCIAYSRQIHEQEGTSTLNHGVRDNNPRIRTTRPWWH